MTRVIFPSLIIIFLQYYAINHITCNAGNSDEYHDCITLLQNELSKRIDEDNRLLDTDVIIDKLLGNKKTLKQNEFSKKILKYIKKHKKRIKALIKHHTIHIEQNNLIHSNSKVKGFNGKTELFEREIESKCWAITKDYRTLYATDLKPKSRKDGIHKLYFSTDATILLYTLKSLQKGFFGDIPKNIEIKKIEERTTQEFFIQDPENEERGDFF